MGSGGRRVMELVVLIAIVSVLAVLHGAVSTWGAVGLSEVDARLGIRGNF
jgi:hypothetical protein